MKNRKVAKQSYVRNTYYCHSVQTEKVHALESALEVDYFNYLNVLGTQSYFEVQPYSVRYKINGREQRYTPDFLVVLGDITYIVEIKYQEEADSDTFQYKSRVLKSFFAKQKLLFIVLTEKDIQIGERAKNLKYLHSARKHQSPTKEIAEFLLALPYRSATISQFQQALRDSGLDPNLCRKAIAHKLINADLTQPWVDVELSW